MVARLPNAALPLAHSSFNQLSDSFPLRERVTGKVHDRTCAKYTFHNACSNQARLSVSYSLSSPTTMLFLDVGASILLGGRPRPFLLRKNKTLACSP